MGVLFTLPVGCLEVLLQSTETGPNSEKKFHESSDHEECLEFQRLVFQLFRSQFVDEDEAVGRSPSTVERTSSLCEGRLHSHILQFPQTLVLFDVLFVDCEEWFKSLVESLPCVRHAISCILFSLEQSQVVDVMVAELLLESV